VPVGQQRPHRLGDQQRRSRRHRPTSPRSGRPHPLACRSPDGPVPGPRVRRGPPQAAAEAARVPTAREDAAALQDPGRH
jgi:hypothetical protein